MSWNLNKWVFGSGEWTKHNIDFCDELFESVAFGHKLRYIPDQNGPRWGPHENEFRIFSNSEMNVTNS